MSLPWFPFYHDAYANDTMHLTTEEHGCYLLMMLAYYKRRGPLPASDRSLAALVKLPMDRWLEAKPALAPFFDEKEGFWHHDRIKAEIKAGDEKHALSVAKARHAAAASSASRKHKANSKPATSTPEAKIKPASSQLQANTSTSTPLYNIGGVEAPPILKNDLKEESRPSVSRINPSFQPDAAGVDMAHAAGLTDADIDIETRKFILTRQEDGGLSANWQASWRKWIEREIAHRAKKTAPPRVQVNVTAETALTAADWRKRLTWFKANESRWSSYLGPEPRMAGCKAPAELLKEFGFA